MHRTSLLFLTVLLFVSCKDAAQNTALQPEQENTVKVVEPAKFHSLIADTPNAQLVDVRTANEVSRGVIDGAAHMCFSCPEFEEQVDGLDKDRPVFLYCKVGGRSSRAAAILKRKGFRQVYDLKGGIDAWQEEGFELALFRRPAK